MDVVYLILIGVGVVSMAAALIMKGKPTGDPDSLLLTYRTADKAETDKKLQQLGNQIRQEKNWLQAQLQEQSAELHQELRSLRERVEQLEASDRRGRETPLADGAIAAPGGQEPQDVDMLALRERYRRVFELQREGLSAEEIAKRLGAGRGEIDLIFSLARKKERGMADA
ncbi:DUF6115 domain-containing protein [Brevibacillus sp. GCM10020057]|uniref:DUF6115 domain-containing protein n=1 Tax=Brevibacillus sp. GCM10020057 TaxID=3317327 RepID=UPI0036382B7B